MQISLSLFPHMQLCWHAGNQKIMTPDGYLLAEKDWKFFQLSEPLVGKLV